MANDVIIICDLLWDPLFCDELLSLVICLDPLVIHLASFSTSSLSSLLNCKGNSFSLNYLLLFQSCYFINS